MSDARTPDLVAAFVEDRLASSAVGEPELLPPSYGSENWLVRLTTGPVAVKISPASVDVAKMRAAWEGHRWAWRGGVPTGEPLLFVEASAPLGGTPVRVVGHIEGVDPRPLLNQGSAIERFFGSLGTALAALHASSPGSFTSRLDGSGAGFASWGAFVEHRSASLGRRAVASGAFEEHDVGRLLSRVETLAGRCPGLRPALCHRDLHFQNLLAASDVTLAGIVDWDLAEAWEPAADFVKLRWQIFAEWPGAAAATVGAYEAAGGHTMTPERLFVVDVLELVNTIANARLDRDAAYEERNRAALAHARADFGA